MTVREKKTLPSLPNPDFIGVALIDKLKRSYREAGVLSSAFKVSSALKPWSPVTSTYISDNGGYADLAKAEIQAARANIQTIVTTLSGQTPPQRIYHDVPAQDWRAAAFDLAQLSRTAIIGAGNTFFVNCAPRLEQRGEQTNNKGENVYAAMLPNGAVVSGVSPHSFAFFRDLVEAGNLEIHKVNVQTDGSQFRSRDFFPWYSELLAYKLAENAEGWKEDLSVAARRKFLKKFSFIDTTQKLELQDIPDLSKLPVVSRVDTHGNLKLSISMSDIRPDLVGVPLSVSINGRTFEAIVRDHMFDSSSGLRGIAPGSSGHFRDSAKKDPRFVEIATIGKSLREELKITDQQLKEGVHVIIEGADKSNVLTFASRPEVANG